MLQHTGLNKASRITVLSSEFSHYLYNVTKEYMNASVHELYIKVVLKNTVHIHYRQRHVVLVTIFVIHTPRSTIPGCGHCWLTCMDWLRNSGGGSDSVGEVAIFRLPSLSISWCYKCSICVEVNPNSVHISFSYASLRSCHQVVLSWTACLGLVNCNLKIANMRAISLPCNH